MTDERIGYCGIDIHLHYENKFCRNFVQSDKEPRNDKPDAGSNEGAGKASLDPNDKGRG